MATTTKQQLERSPLKIPPQDLAAERAVLGSILIKSGLIEELADYLRPEDFYPEKHRAIFRAMIELFNKSEPIDTISLSSALEKNGVLERIGGSTYLAELSAEVPSAANATYYAEIVKNKSVLRRLIDSADTIMDLGYGNHQEDTDSIIDRAEKLILNLSSTAKRNYIALKDTLTEAWERFDKLHKSDGSLRGIPTGFPGLDNLLAGFQKSDLIILAARPSNGKTSLALDIARHVACHNNHPVAIFSLEMSAQQLVDRVIAAEARVNSWELRTGKIKNDDDYERIQDSYDILSKAPIFIDDEPGNNITKMRSTARRIKAQHGLGLIVVDYLQLMVPRKDSDSLVQQVTEISRSLKGLARELDVPVLALSQLSRAVEQRRDKPRLSDLRDSGSIEQDADVVMFIHRGDKYDENSDRKNVAEILVEKHRNGPTGKVELYFNDKWVSFTSIEKSDFGSFN